MDRPEGVFEVERTVDDLEGSHIFNFSCGYHGETWEFDSRLKAGQVFETSQGIRLIGGSVHEDFITTSLLQVDSGDKKIRSRRSSRTSQLDSSTIQGSSLNWFEELCTYNVQNLTFDKDCTITQLSPDLEADPKNDEDNDELQIRQCLVSVRDEKNPPQPKVEYGIYRFPDGREIKAYRQTSIKTGPMLCVSPAVDLESENGPRDVGIGTTVETKISSLEMTSPGIGMTCGGPTAIFRHNKTTNVSGETYQETNFEFLGGKF